jgi:HEAT repeat protein
MFRQLLAIGICFGFLSFWPIGCVSNSSKKVVMAIERGDVCEAIKEYGAQKREDLALLSEIAEALIEREAKAPEKARRDAAFREMRLSGNGAKRVLLRLSQGGDASIPRAKALELLMDLGDGGAKEDLLASLGSTEPEIISVALGAFDPETDVGRVLKALESPWPEVRQKAAVLLGRAHPQSDVRIALTEAVRLDPEPKVRSAALISLATYGAESLPTIEPLLSDQNLSVRQAAIRALVRADYNQAEHVLDKYLNAVSGPEGVEAARQLIIGKTSDKGSAAGAFNYLYRALSSSDPAIRAQAAVTLDGLPVDSIDVKKVVAYLEKEKAPAVKLLLATTLLSVPEANRAVDSALLEIMNKGGVPGAQAAAERAVRGDQNALQKLFDSRSDPSVLIRRVVVRLIARKLGHPHEVFNRLCDDDSSVRVIAAGAILAVSASSQ